MISGLSTLFNLSLIIVRKYFASHFSTFTRKTGVIFNFQSYSLNYLYLILKNKNHQHYLRELDGIQAGVCFVRRRKMILRKKRAKICVINKQKLLNFESIISCKL